MKEAVVEEELESALGGRQRYQRQGTAQGYRNGHRDRQLVGTFGAVTVWLPRARLFTQDGGEREWKSAVVPAYKRVTKRAEAIIAGAYFAGANTRHVLDDLLAHGLRAPELVIVGGGKGLEAALANLWSDVPVQCCTVHKERNLLAQAPTAQPLDQAA